MMWLSSSPLPLPYIAERRPLVHIAASVVQSIAEQHPFLKSGLYEGDQTTPVLSSLRVSVVITAVQVGIVEASRCCGKSITAECRRFCIGSLFLSRECRGAVHAGMAFDLPEHLASHS